MRQEKEISKNFYRFWRMSNLRGFLGRCAKVVANSKYFYNFGSMRQNVGELRKKSSPKFGFAKRCRIDPKFGASTQKASQIRHSPKFALFSGFKLWRIVRSPALDLVKKVMSVFILISIVIRNFKKVTPIANFVYIMRFYLYG